MCGIAGFYKKAGFQYDWARESLVNQAATLIHRGPDSSGVWIDVVQGIAMAHRRLSILDLSPAGHQPMKSHSGRFVIIFNGEIYNHLDMRREVEKKIQVPWKGHSDTESLLAGFDCWGVENTLKKTVGMFAFAVWDQKLRVLILARDRMGEKPLYYGWQDDVFLFGSELKSLTAHPAFKPMVNRDVLPLFLQHGYIPAPHSIYRGICKLLPGTFLAISGNDPRHYPLDPAPYWSLRHVAEAGVRNPVAGSEKEIVNGLEERLVRSVSLQRVADVPLGAFLSGGIDSATVVALMQSQSTQPIRTFTVGFHEQAYNEATHAEAIAKYLGTDHTSVYLSFNEIIEKISELHDLYDEPFSDSSASFLVSALARKEVKVSLSGDGGDELFGGYLAYQMMNSLWKKIVLVPSTFRQLLSQIVLIIPPEMISCLISPLLKKIEHNTSIPAGHRVHQLAVGLKNLDPFDFFRIMKTHGNVERSLIKKSRRNKAVLPQKMEVSGLEQFFQFMMYFDAKEYLSDDILVKVDRSAMAVGLETRTPMLDHRIVEYSWRLPIDMKVRNGEGKWLLRQVLYRYLPRELVDRPKMGFNLPMAEWLRGPLREISEDFLSRKKLEIQGFFEADVVRKIFKDHLNGRANWQALLWRIISFQSWTERKKVKPIRYA